MNNILSYTIVGIDQVTAPIRNVIRSIDRMSTAFQGASVAMKANLALMALQGIASAVELVHKAFRKWSMAEEIDEARKAATGLWQELSKAANIGFDKLKANLDRAISVQKSEKDLAKARLEDEQRLSAARTKTANMTSGGAIFGTIKAREDRQAALTEQMGRASAAKMEADAAAKDAQTRYSSALEQAKRVQQLEGTMLGVKIPAPEFEQGGITTAWAALTGGIKNIEPTNKAEIDAARQRQKSAREAFEAQKQKAIEMRTEWENASRTAETSQNRARTEAQLTNELRKQNEIQDQQATDEKRADDARRQAQARAGQTGILKAAAEDEAKRREQSLAIDAYLADKRIKRIIEGRAADFKGPEDQLRLAGDIPSDPAAIEGTAGLTDRIAMFFDRGSARGYVADQRAQKRRMEALRRAAESNASSPRQRIAKAILEDMDKLAADRANAKKLQDEQDRALRQAQIETRDYVKLIHEQDLKLS